MLAFLKAYRLHWASIEALFLIVRKLRLGKLGTRRGLWHSFTAIVITGMCGGLTEDFFDTGQVILILDRKIIHTRFKIELLCILVGVVYWRICD